MMIAVAPKGKFRVIADDFGKWNAEHTEVLVGDYYSMSAAEDAANAYLTKPYWERWTVRIYDDAGRLL